MNRRQFNLSLACLASVAWCVVFGQEGDGSSKAKKTKIEDESARMFKLIEKAYKKPQTERDRVIKELTRLAPEQAMRPDYESWFERVARGQAVWDRRSIDRMDLAEIFDRMAERMQEDSGRISRAQFIHYARRHWQEDNSPLWKEPKQIDLGYEAEKLYRKLDRDSDGQLSDAEIPKALRADLKRWDRDRDGAIDFQEYLSYFPIRLVRLEREWQQPATLLENRNGSDERPRVFRPGKLPEELPDWFAVLDMDGDGQVALYEWRRASWSIAEFSQLDRNDDGFLIPEEILQIVRAVERDGKHPLAAVLEREAPALSTKSASGGKRDQHKN